jgi:hypothetical protein
MRDTTANHGQTVGSGGFRRVQQLSTCLRTISGRSVVQCVKMMFPSVLSRVSLSRTTDSGTVRVFREIRTISIGGSRVLRLNRFRLPGSFCEISVVSGNALGRIYGRSGRLSVSTRMDAISCRKFCGMRGVPGRIWQSSGGWVFGNCVGWRMVCWQS